MRHTNNQTALTDTKTASNLLGDQKGSLFNNRQRGVGGSVD